MQAKNPSQQITTADYCNCGGLCCSGKAFCSACCAGCAKMGVPAKNFPRVAYVVHDVLWMCFSVILLYTLKGAAEQWDWFQCTETHGTVEETDENIVEEVVTDAVDALTETVTGVDTPEPVTSTTCYGTSAVLRMSFTLFCFHFLVLVAIVPRAMCSSVIHDAFWPGKILFVALLYIASFFIPHWFFVGWAHFCRGGSALFLLIQAYFLLNMAYTFNDQLIAKTQ